MGSTGYYLSNYNKGRTAKQIIDDANTETSVNLTIKWRVLRSITKGSVYYAAIERYNSVTEEREVFAAVQPYSYYGKGWDRELIVKSQDETQGPVASQCPNNILDLLTEPFNEYAEKWRARCRDYNEAQKDKPKICVGDVIVFEEPFTFGGWGKASKFEVISWGRKKRFRTLDASSCNFACRLTRDAFKYGRYSVEKA